MGKLPDIFKDLGTIFLSLTVVMWLWERSCTLPKPQVKMPVLPLTSVVINTKQSNTTTATKASLDANILGKCKRAVETEEAIRAKVHVLVPGRCVTTFRTVRDPGTGHCCLGGKTQAHLTGSSCSDVVRAGAQAVSSCSTAKVLISVESTDFSTPHHLQNL